MVLFFGFLGSRADSPTVSITSSNVTHSLARIGDTVTVSISSPTGTAPSSVTIDGIPATITGGPLSWNASVVLTANQPAGTVTFAVTSADGSVTTTSDHSNVTFFPAQPIAEILAVDALPNVASSRTPIQLMVTFTEPVVYVGPSSFTATNATVTRTESIAYNQIFLVQVVPTTPGQYSVTLPAGTVFDHAGNTTGSATLSFVYDPSAPTAGVVKTPSAPSMPSNTTSGSSAPVTSANKDLPLGTATSIATSGLISTSSILIATDTAPSMMASDTATTTSGSASTAVWLGIIIILVLLIGGGWWYSRTVNPTV